ncbi:MAG: type II toxin-antitoxin system HicB family antitoxin [Proteobacteria bacterium]|nr:type II toxin-antitoxin system HicB family antitoxin [Pseudomonadota bacterium]
MASLTYVALVQRAKKKNADYGVFFPDFPGCVFGGKTLDKALENAREGLIFHIEGLVSAGERLPKPTSLEKIKSNPEYKDATSSLIRIITPSGRLARINISMDTDLITEIDLAAKMARKNRSEFLAEAAREKLA